MNYICKVLLFRMAGLYKYSKCHLCLFNNVYTYMLTFQDTAKKYVIYVRKSTDESSK